MGAPAITIITALPPATRATPIVFTIVGDGFPLRRAWASASFAGLIGDEVVHTGLRFGAFYTNGTNVRASITNGYQYTILRDGGWPSAPSLDISGVDTVGNNGGLQMASQVFTYVATGVEGATFTVTLPLARTDHNYLAIAFNAGLSGADTTFDTPSSAYTNTTLQVTMGYAPAAGDKIGIILCNLT